MTETSIVEIGLAFLGVLFTVIGFLLSQKDAAQAELIKDLYRKHENDEKSLNEHKVELAKMHYTKSDIDPKIEEMKRSINDGFKYLGERFDALGERLLDHIQKEDTRPQSERNRQ